MCADRLIVLKFGGSVLRDERSLTRVVHEIHRWRRNDWRVLAVVSALQSRTDALAAKARSVSDPLNGYVEAQFLAQGEFECAALLSLYLDRAGIPATSISPAAAQFIAKGGPLNADPHSVNIETLRRTVVDRGVCVVPGFVAMNAAGYTVTLGRGGSDLSALFFAETLDADRCRLIKDVDGVYDCDPASHPLARRYERASYDDALATDGSILQRRAVQFAQGRSLEFDVAALNSVQFTTIGTNPSAFAGAPLPERPLRAAMLGLGVVNGGVYAHLARRPCGVEIVSIAVRDPNRMRDIEAPRRLLMTDPVQCATSGVDVVIEAMGGVDEAYYAVRAALLNGADVVTANKALIATHGEELATLAASHRRSLLCSGAVGGAAPILETLRANHDRHIRRVTGVLNGTCNFILDAIAGGAPVEAAVEQAQRLGFAESDPTDDLSGADVMHKLSVIARTAGAAQFTSGNAEALTEAVAKHVTHISDACVRQIATLECDRSNRVCGRVQYEHVDPSSEFAATQGPWNTAIIEWADGDTSVIRGKGAGRWPTAESVIGDVLELVRKRHRRADVEPASLRRTSPATRCANSTAA